MEASLTPELAVAYLRELSLDVRAAVVLDGRGGYLAGSLELVAPAGAMLRVPEAEEGLAIRTRGGWVVGARSETVGVAVAAGRLTVVGLMRHDVLDVVGSLSPGRPAAGPARSPRTSAQALQALADGVERAASRVATPPSTNR